jgi:hypothetical protein
MRAAGMRAAGMRIAIVGTGGDPGYAPARHPYEKAATPAFRARVLPGVVESPAHRPQTVPRAGRRRTWAEWESPVMGSE